MLKVSRVVPSIGDIILRFSSARVLNKVDFPTFLFPIIPMYTVFFFEVKKMIF